MYVGKLLAHYRFLTNIRFFPSLQPPVWSHCVFTLGCKSAFYWKTQTDLILMLLNSGSAAHCLQANTWEISVGWKGKFALFRRLATWGKVDSCSFSYTYYQWPVNRNKADSIVITNGNGLGETKMNWPNRRNTVSTKKYSHNLNVEGYFIWWKCLALWAPRRQHLSSSEKTTPNKRDGQPGYIQVCNKGNRKSEHQRLDIKLKNLAFYLWANARLWAHWNHSLHVYLSLLLFSRSVISLWPHGLQHTRLPCPSPSPGVCSNSCPLSKWCHPTISSSIVPFSSCLQSFSASGFFPVSQLFTTSGSAIRGQILFPHS